VEIRSTVTTYPAFAIGAIAGVVGFVLQGAQGAVLWLVVGYFLGKTMESARRMLTAGGNA
jgi:Na+/alanine symporter